MLKKWWRHRQERRAAQERNDAETIVDGRRDVEHEHLAAGMSDAGKLPPIFKNTDWTGGGPL